MWSVAPRFGNKPLAGVWNLEVNDKIIVNLTSSSSFRLYLLTKQQYAAFDQNIGEKECCPTCVDPFICYNAERDTYDFTSVVKVANAYRIVAVCPNLLANCDITNSVYVVRKSPISDWNTVTGDSSSLPASSLSPLHFVITVFLFIFMNENV